MTEISYSDVESFLIETRSRIESALNKMPLKEQGKIRELERRSQNLLDAISTVQSESYFYGLGI